MKISPLSTRVTCRRTTRHLLRKVLVMVNKTKREMRCTLASVRSSSPAPVLRP